MVGVDIAANENGRDDKSARVNQSPCARVCVGHHVFAVTAPGHMSRGVVFEACERAASSKPATGRLREGSQDGCLASHRGIHVWPISGPDRMRTAFGTGVACGSDRISQRSLAA